MTSSWISLEPVFENDGTRYAWRLVARFDPDWQDFLLTAEQGWPMRFELHLADDMLDAISEAVDRARGDCKHGYRAAGGGFDCPACEAEARDD